MSWKVESGWIIKSEVALQRGAKHCRRAANTFAFKSVIYVARSARWFGAEGRPGPALPGRSGPAGGPSAFTNPLLSMTRHDRQCHLIQWQSTSRHRLQRPSQPTPGLKSPRGWSLGTSVQESLGILVVFKSAFFVLKMSFSKTYWCEIIIIFLNIRWNWTWSNQVRMAHLVKLYVPVPVSVQRFVGSTIGINILVTLLTYFHIKKSDTNFDLHCNSSRSESRERFPISIKKVCCLAWFITSKSLSFLRLRKNTVALNLG